jgi:hypothetical protein
MISNTALENGEIVQHLLPMMIDDNKISFHGHRAQGRKTVATLPKRTMKPMAITRSLKALKENITNAKASHNTSHYCG